MGTIYDKLVNAHKNVNRLDVFNKTLSENTIARRWLTNFVMELTPLCNFACKMCYIRMTPEQMKETGHELVRFDTLKKYIDDFCDMGAINCTLTGGECTTHPDFCKIYEYIYNKGIQINVMTNGANITDEIFEMFKKYPPLKILITLYGSTPETYRELCGNEAGFEKAYYNVRRLKEAKMYVVLQFTSTKDNQHELRDVYEFSKELRCELRYTDFLIGFNKSTPEQIKENEDDCEQFKKDSKYIWCDKRGISEDEAPSETKNEIYPSTNNPIVEKGVPCNAGRNTCCINWKGEMQSCNVMDMYKVDLTKKSVREAWEDIVKWSDEVPRIIECQNCIYRLKCRSCVGQHYGDTGEFGKPSPRICYKILYPEKAAEFEKRYKIHMEKMQTDKEYQKQYLERLKKISNK